jgi:OOP family OmpA-OmpF porin
MRRLLATASLVALILSLTPDVLPGQTVGERLRARARARASARVDRGVERVLDEFEGAIACVAGDAACQQRARAAGKPVVLTDSDGAVLPPDQQPPDSPARRPREGSAAAGRPGEGVWANFDFVPGERVIFAEDFKSDRVGNFPARLELVTGNLEVVEWQGGRWLRMMSEGALTIPLPEVLPTRFTMEFTFVIPWHGVAIYSAAEADQLGPAASSRSSAAVLLSATQAGVIRANSGTGSIAAPNQLFRDYFADEAAQGVSRPFRVRVEVDGRYVKVYLDEKRVANIPNANFGRANQLVMEFTGPLGETNAGMVTDISINAGGRGLYDALVADGRVATQGILFDVGSDRLRGESTPTLRQIGQMMTEHPELKLAVEGHTDNTGTAAANLALSTRRAQAIVTYLTTSLSVDPDRLTSQGFGQTRPVGPNTTPEGRQANRRVELVKE